MYPLLDANESASAMRYQIEYFRIRRRAALILASSMSIFAAATYLLSSF
jgi:hypothetical protein